MKIAVIGSGVAGLGAAWALEGLHEVVLYEAADRLGGHANTVTIDYNGARIDVDTGFIAAEESDLVAEPLSEMGVEDAAHRLRHVAAGSGDSPDSPWDSLTGAVGFRANATSRITQSVVVDGVAQIARMLDDDDHPMTRLIGLSATRVIAFENGSAFEVRAFAKGGSGTGGPASDGSLRAPMPGKIVATPAKPGDTVTKGQTVVVLEAMKMEHALVAPFDGVVGGIGVSVGDQVAADTVLATVTAGEA